MSNICEDKYGGHSWGPWFAVAHPDGLERRECRRCNQGAQLRKRRRRLFRWLRK